MARRRRRRTYRRNPSTVDTALQLAMVGGLAYVGYRVYQQWQAGQTATAPDLNNPYINPGVGNNYPGKGGSYGINPNANT